MSARKARLLGSDATTLGELTTTETGPAGLALSRARFPKPISFVDPNEDAVVAAGHGDRWLLGVADGHHGFDAALAAVTAIDAVAEQVLSDDRDGRAGLNELVDHTREAVAEALRATTEERAGSRTALSVVLVRGREALATTCGDSSVFLVRRRRVRSLTSPARFLGPRTAPPPVVRVRLRAADRLAVVTDGFTDFVGRASAMTLRRELAAQSPAAAAEGLVQAAFAGGAGDNVGVAVLLPGGRA